MRRKFSIILSILILTSTSFAQFYGRNSSQKKAENATITYLSDLFKESTYVPYSFGDLVKVTPKQILEVEDLKRKKDSLYKVDSSHAELPPLLSNIDNKLAYIKANKLHSTYEIDHFYTVQKTDNKPTLYHSLFTLYPDGQMKEVSNLLIYPFIENEEDYYYHYHKRYPLVVETNLNDKQYNLQTYAFLDGLYLNEPTSKEAAMSTILSTVQIITSTGFYDTTLIAQLSASKYIKKERKLTLIDKINFSNVNQLKDSNDNIIGYKLFVIFVNESKEDEMLYFEFDYNYVIRNVLAVEPPYEPYLKQ